MSDAKQPGIEFPAVVESPELLVGLEQGFLHDVFAIERRAGHARAIAMQAWTQMRDTVEKGDTPCIEKTDRVEVGLNAHIVAPWLVRGRF